MSIISLSDIEIEEITSKIEKNKLTANSHLYKRYPGKTIGEAAEIFSLQYSNEAKEKPGLVVLSVIFSAHRDYTKQVEPQVDRIRRLNFKSLNDLKKKTIDFETFSNFAGMRVVIGL